MDELVRAPHFEGLFYPSDPQELKQTINHSFSEPNSNKKDKEIVLSGCILPHGAYEYCGKILGSTIRGLHRQLNSARTSKYKDISRILILAPELNPGVEGIKLPQSNIFRSPIGDTWVDTDYCNVLETSSMLYQVDETSHLQEYTIEIVLPFLQEWFPHLPIVPLLVQPETPIQRLPMLLSGLRIAEQESTGRSLVLCISNCHKPAPLDQALILKDTYFQLLRDQTREQLIDTFSTTANDHPFIPYGFFACALGIHMVRLEYGNLHLLSVDNEISPPLDFNKGRIHYHGFTFLH
jgi:AmmeMemoRadiSam system protein B